MPTAFKKTLGKLPLSAECRALIAEECKGQSPVRLNRVLGALSIVRSVWHAKPVVEPKKPGRKPKGGVRGVGCEDQGVG